MKGSFVLHRLRTIFAMLIAVSLSFAPITPASGAVQKHARMGPMTAAASPAADGAMSECMKAMQSQGQAQDQKCPCCENMSKAVCPDISACLLKCSAHVIAILTPVAESRLPTIRHKWAAELQKPPDWSRTPPAPPPRA